MKRGSELDRRGGGQTKKIFLTVIVILALPSADAQESLPLTVCEGASISLGQTKQEVRKALTVCCRYKNSQFKGKNGEVEYPNQIVFEADRADRTCTGAVLFDKAETAVFASRDLGQFDESSDGLSFARALTEAMNSLLPVAKTPGEQDTIKVADVTTFLVISAGPTGSSKELSFTVQGHTLRLRLGDSSKHPSDVLLTEEIGDIYKWDRTSVPLKK
jgi:hypothetical protein